VQRRNAEEEEDREEREGVYGVGGMSVQGLSEVARR
jgi:hypothetical protein